MTIKLAVDVRNAKLDAIETQISTSPVLKIFAGGVPALITDPASGTVLVTMNLPSDWMNAASNAQKTLNGTWQDASADNTGTATHFRLFKTDGTTQQMQGTVTAVGGGGDLQLETDSIVAGQQVTIIAFTWAEGNA